MSKQQNETTANNSISTLKEFLKNEINNKQSNLVHIGTYSFDGDYDSFGGDDYIIYLNEDECEKGFYYVQDRVTANVIENDNEPDDYIIVDAFNYWLIDEAEAISLGDLSEVELEELKY